VALRPCDIAVPDFRTEPDLADLIDPVRDAMAQLSIHRLITVDLTGLRNVLASSPVSLSSMGRGLGDDPGYFLAAAAAGRHAATLVP
jgi:hypothetical protein